MLWKKDKLRPTQPYFVLDSKNFRQEVYLQQGISHFYTFEVEKPQMLNAVPDACIDLFFEYTQDGLEAYACGTPLRFTSHEWRDRREVFGVRFMPGVQPEIIRAKMKDLADERVPLSDIVLDEKLIPLMAEQKDFYQRIRVFLQQYTKSMRRWEKKKSAEKEELVWAVKRMVYESDGKIRIAKL